MPTDSHPQSSDRETVLQFGGGNFLRAFADQFLHEANQAGQDVGHAVVVTSTDSDRTRWINDQAGRYHVIVRGLMDGAPVEDTLFVDQGISRALSARQDWSAVCQLARSPELRWVVSNTTEAGLRLTDDEIDPVAAPTDLTPVSFPAKLLRVLSHRHTASLPGLTILPCELVDDNALILRDLVLEQARRWGLPQKLVAWLTEECHWVNTLVDRIVAGRPEDHPLLEKDHLLTMAEPYALWVVEDQDDEDRPGLDLFDHDAIQRVAHVEPYSLRKVRILNGAHTALVARALPMGIETVGDAVAHKDVGPWLEQLLTEEILPALGDRVEGASDFAAHVLERFANPWLHHRLADIALHHETKLQTRLQPTFDDYVDRFGEAPSRLEQILSTVPRRT